MTLQTVQKSPAHKLSLVTGHITQYSRLTTERLNAGTESIRPAAEDLQSSERAVGFDCNSIHRPLTTTPSQGSKSPYTDASIHWATLRLRRGQMQRQEKP